MKQVAIILSAALVLFLSSCAQTGIGGSSTDSLSGSAVNDVLRDGDFAYETVVSVGLSVGVDLEAATVGSVSVASSGTEEQLVIVTLLDEEGDVLLRGTASEGSTFETEVLVPNVDFDATLQLEASGYEIQEIGIQNLAQYQSVNRRIGMKPGKGDSDTNDADGDGVPDIYDVAPTDPYIAFYRRIPSEKSLTVAFEDNFPELGDGDYNDFIARYTMEEYRDSKNRLVTVNGTVEAIARAAGYDHEFGIVLEHPSQQGDVTVTHYDAHGQIVDGYSETNSDVSRLVIFRNTKNAFTRSGGVTMDNPRNGDLDSIGHTAEFLIDFAQAGQADPNAVCTWNANDPYLLVHDTGFDIHLIGQDPLPGSSNPDSSSSFRDENGYPRALLVPENWPYPEDQVFIETAYPEFVNWRESSGSDSTDWYLYPDLSVVVN